MERIEQLEKQILEIAQTIEDMHKPEYATFFIGDDQLDGYAYAEAIRKSIKSDSNATHTFLEPRKK